MREFARRSTAEKLSVQRRLTAGTAVPAAAPVDIDRLVPTSSTAPSTTSAVPRHAALRIDFSSRSIFSIDSRNAESLVTLRMIRLYA